jgi:hypothetical protein
MTATSGGADLQQLMMIGDLYARKLVADAGPPSRILMLERAGALDCVVLDREDRDPATRVRHLLTQHRATSAVLLFEAETVVAGAVQTVFCVLGETVEGETAGRHYRVRRRRLTPLVDGEASEVEGVFRPLFPVPREPVGMDDAAIPLVSSDAAPDATTTGRSVAA